ncbi:TniQ family protein [Pseudomonas cremoricolorata]|uniref:TniQ family protein n=1 Tax=Pseudomonas cremoricolorata TaxID=157783 RepID=UPI0009DEAF21|nr:TniQ family protein [Pseudomonas cremoricolorata]
MRIFSPLPGEYIASALKRGNELLGIKSIRTEDFYIKPIPRVGFGISKSMLPLKAEWREHPKFKFPEFISKYNITESVLNNHTLHPLNAALGRSRALTEVTPKTWTRICPECVLEDIEEHGSPYIHRRHVLSFVMVCSIHGSPLIDTCPYCSVSIKKHDITHLRICSIRYKYSKQSKSQKKSTPRLYAQFIADLLQYRGAMAKSGKAEALICCSVHLKYGRRHADFNASMGIDSVIEEELGISVNTKINVWSMDRNISLYAFLGCQTAENYLKLLSDEESVSQLNKALDDAWITKWQHY